MYKQYLQLEDAKNKGKGVFTTVQIPADMPILEINGPIYTDRDIPDKDYSRYLQVGPNIFIGPSGCVDDYFNHSCDPNCKLHIVGNRAFLYSLYVIPARAELTFDYSTSSTDTKDNWQMECKCGSSKCRKIISGHQYLDDNLKEKYKKNGMFPLFILEPNLFQKA